MSLKGALRCTWAIPVVILDPPTPWMLSSTSSVLLNTNVGDMEDAGALPGSIKFGGDGGRSYIEGESGLEKSPISLLKIIPVRDPTIFEPNLGDRIMYICHQVFRCNVNAPDYCGLCVICNYSSVL